MNNLKSDASALLFGLDRGYLRAEEVVEWADNLILKSRTVPTEISNISLSRGVMSAIQKHLHVLVETFGSQPDPQATLKCMQQVLALHPERAERLASALIHLFAGEESTSPAAAEAHHVDYSFELAASGVQGSYDSASSELRSYLQRWALSEVEPQPNSS